MVLTKEIINKNGKIVKIEELSKNSHAFVDVECNGCHKTIYNICFQNYNKQLKARGEYYCTLCARAGYKKWISFYEWCYWNLPKDEADKILDRWDYELNIDKNGKQMTPENISSKSTGNDGKGYWFKCLNRPEHKSELKRIIDFVQGNAGTINCKQCKSISVTHPNLISMLVNKEDGLKYSYASEVKILVKCPECGHEKKSMVCDLVNRGIRCNKCGDGRSYPNKIGFNMLEQLLNCKEIKFFENEKTFDWCKFKFKFKEKLRKGVYDFYFELNNDEKYILEMDGDWHYKDNHRSGQTKEESKFIDDEKDRLADEKGIKVIRIDCRISELEYIKNNLFKSCLNDILNLNNINWEKCEMYSSSNLVKESCNLWNSGIRSAISIANKLKLSRGVVTNYLKKGTALGWCNPHYNPKDELLKNTKSFKKRISKKVICLTTGLIYNSQTEAARQCECSIDGVSKCCKNKQKTCGQDKITSEPFRWMFHNEYIKLNPTTV